ncbi:MAG: dihydrodipicolinate synthase family protein [Planctomycetaceae bacterium]|nr:dihydrodipicolinate synthase family protein [Planctomycetaceae bacterium]|tara:strand:+ start:3432 stop:4367 length:936 start_codon:yes stop_codon:yes gene_type:complete
MQTSPITQQDLARSVVSVPPLARNDDLSLNEEENRKIVQHLEAGGISTFLYGGNALLYHVAPSQYGELLSMLEGVVADNSLVIPSVGSSYGMMMDQARVIRDTSFPTAMVLPQPNVVTYTGVERAIGDYVQAAGKPAVVYIKQLGYIEVEHVKRLVENGSVSWIKYAIVRDDPAEDEYLQRLKDAIGTDMIVSGIGEQPALPHMEKFDVTAFTSGCVCIAPALSMRMLKLIQLGEFAAASQIREVFKPLEDLRNGINPVRVLHAAVAGAGIAETGPLLPMMSPVNESQRVEIAEVAKTLLKAEMELRAELT